MIKKLYKIYFLYKFLIDDTSHVSQESSIDF